MDYAWLTDPQANPNPEAGMPFVVLYDRRTQYVASHVVPKKGADPYAIQRVVKTLQYLGYNEFILKSDDENSIKTLKREVKKAMPFVGRITLEESPRYDDQAKGGETLSAGYPK